MKGSEMCEENGNGARRDTGAELRAAAARGDHIALERLLDAGVDVNARDEQGYTALMRAAYAGSLESVRLLLDRGASINSTTDTGETALMGAALGRNVEVV